MAKSMVTEQGASIARFQRSDQVLLAGCLRLLSHLCQVLIPPPMFSAN
jgi:hypothetical protein